MDRGRRISFWSRVEVGSIEDCWNWKGNLRKNGYGRSEYIKKLEAEKEDER